jgi:hypothetical protein
VDLRAQEELLTSQTVLIFTCLWLAAKFSLFSISQDFTCLSLARIFFASLVEEVAPFPYPFHHRPFPFSSAHPPYQLWLSLASYLDLASFPFGSSDIPVHDPCCCSYVVRDNRGEVAVPFFCRGGIILAV